MPLVPPIAIPPPPVVVPIVDSAPILPDAADPEAIIVLGSRLEPDRQTVVAGEEAQAVLVQDARDILDRLPGVRASSTAGVGGTSFVSIRGGEPNFAQITIDGVRVSNPSNSAGGGFDFAQLDPFAIAATAVVPGSRSAIYGADALSGVLAVELRAGQEDRLAVSGRIDADSRDGWASGAAIGSGWRSGGLFLSGSAYDSGDLSPDSTLERRQLLAKLTQTVGPVAASAFALRAVTERSAFPESSGGPELAVNRARETRETGLTVLGARLTSSEEKRIVPSLGIGYVRERTELDTPAIFPGEFGAVPALASDTVFQRFETTGSMRATLARDMAVVAGIDYQREDARSSGTIDLGFPLPTGFAIDRDQYGVFAELGYLPETGLRSSVALRHDRFEGLGETTLQANIGWRMASNVEPYASYAEGFKLPSLFALAFPLTANPDLLPERSASRELGVAWRPDEKTRMALALFDTEYTDLIDFDPELFTTVNRGETRIRGLTASGDIGLGRTLRISGSATWLDIDAAVALRGRPEWSGYLRTDWAATEGLALGAAFRFSNEFLESAIPTGIVPLDGYAVLDLFGEWRASDTITVSVALRNAGNEDYREAVGFPAPGRVFRARIGFDF